MTDDHRKTYRKSDWDQCAGFSKIVGAICSILTIFLYASVIFHHDWVKVTSICLLEGDVGENENEKIEDSCVHDGR